MSSSNESKLHYLRMNEVEDGNYEYITGDNINQFVEILVRKTCWKYVTESFIQRPWLISSVSTPH